MCVASIPVFTLRILQKCAQRPGRIFHNVNAPKCSKSAPIKLKFSAQKRNTIKKRNVNYHYWFGLCIRVSRHYEFSCFYLSTLSVVWNGIDVRVWAFQSGCSRILSIPNNAIYIYKQRSASTDSILTYCHRRRIHSTFYCPPHTTKTNFVCVFGAGRLYNCHTYSLHTSSSFLYCFFECSIEDIDITFYTCSCASCVMLMMIHIHILCQANKMVKRNKKNNLNRLR